MTRQVAGLLATGAVHYVHFVEKMSQSSPSPQR